MKEWRTKHLKILAFTFRSTMVGGSNRSFLTVVEGLKNRCGHHITVVLPEKGPLCSCLDEIGVPYVIYPSYMVSAIDLNSLPNVIRLAKYAASNFFDWIQGSAIAKRLKSEKYDLVYINDNPTYVGAYVARDLGLPYVWHLRSPRTAKAKYVPGSKALYTNAKRLIAISESMRKQYKTSRTTSGANFELVYNAIPMKECQPAIRSTENGFHIIQCGRISKAKGQMEAVQAICILREQYHIQDVFLHIVGNAGGKEGTKYLNKIKQYLQRHDLGEHIVLEGYREDVDELRKDMCCEVVCSANEPFGRVTVEGMRAGLVLIGANCGGTVELIKDGETGLLYEHGKPEDLADKIASIYHQRDMADALALNGFSYATQHYNMEELIERIDSIFHSVIDC
jgi:glycosyltransferase involved in cell wall biosynthesis